MLKQICISKNRLIFKGHQTTSVGWLTFSSSYKSNRFFTTNLKFHTNLHNKEREASLSTVCQNGFLKNEELLKKNVHSKKVLSLYDEVQLSLKENHEVLKKIRSRKGPKWKYFYFINSAEQKDLSNKATFTKYYFENGLRKVKPYFYTNHFFVKRE